MNSQGKIILIDDDPDHQHLLGKMLRNKGYRVHNLLGCGSLQGMMDAVLLFQPDLIFMDHSMPQVCGIEATRTLRSYPVTKNIPVIYFSGEDDIEVLSEKAGADAFLRKSFKPQEMQRLLDLYI